MKRIREKLKLNLPTIEAVYKELDFEVKPPKTSQSVTSKLNEFFLADSLMDELQKNFEIFQTVPDSKNYPWSDKVHDLYELAYYIENESEPSPDFYRRRDTQDLCEIFVNESKKVAQPISAWQSIKALLNLAQTQVFNTSENRFKYDHSLKLEVLRDFFDKLKNAPEVFKRDNYFANNCINKIRRTFPNFLNYELSAAIYNKAAGLLKDPYESVDDTGELFFSVTCANCGAFESFRTREEAERAHCKICGENFYIECPKCGKKNPAVAERCANCNFSLSELRRYDDYILQANSILDLVEHARTMDDGVNKVVAEVIKILAKAKLAKPEAMDLKKIEWRINKIAAEFKKRDLIKWAESKMPSLSTHPDKAVSDCVEILRKIKDYKPAIERLRLIKPKKPLSISATIQESSSQSPSSKVSGAAILSKISVNAKSAGVANATSNLTCTISWQPDNDLEIFYTVIRKTDGIPQNYRDGDIIVENTDKLEVIDPNFKPGVFYGYAVFATRRGSISSPTTCTAVHYSDIEERKFIAKTEDGHCKFIWKLPAENCLGVRISRSDSAGNSVVVADCVQSPFVDRLVKNRKQYQYHLQCVYYNAEESSANREKFFAEAGKENFNRVWKVTRTFKYSRGISVTLTPERPPQVLKNLHYNVTRSHVTFRWQSTGEFAIWFKEIKPQKAAKKNFLPNLQAGKIFDLDKIDELLGSGLVYKRAESSDQFCEFEINDDITKIAVISATRTAGIVTEFVTVANLEPCEIDKDNTQIDSNGLKLVLKSAPKNLYLIHYKINTKDRDSEQLFATIEDAKARRINRIYASKYLQDTFISQMHLEQKELYITVIGEFKLNDGTTAFSEPSTLILNNRPKAVISYRLEWGTSGLFSKKAHAKDCKIIIASDAADTPRLYLACRKDGRMNIELDDSSTQILHTFLEYKGGYPGGQIEIDLPNDTWKNVLPGTVVKLLPGREDSKYFDMKATKPDSLTVPNK